MVGLVNLTMLKVGNYNYTGDVYNHTMNNSDKYNHTSYNSDNSDLYNYALANTTTDSDKHSYIGNTTISCGEQLSDQDWETVSQYR